MITLGYISHPFSLNSCRNTCRLLVVNKISLFHLKHKQKLFYLFTDHNDHITASCFAATKKFNKNIYNNVLNYLLFIYLFYLPLYLSRQVNSYIQILRNNFTIHHGVMFKELSAASQSARKGRNKPN